jgi:hypothetical protein
MAGSTFGEQVSVASRPRREPTRRSAHQNPLGTIALAWAHLTSVEKRLHWARAVDGNAVRPIAIATSVTIRFIVASGHLLYRRSWLTERVTCSARTLIDLDASFYLRGDDLRRQEFSGVGPSLVWSAAAVSL